MAFCLLLFIYQKKEKRIFIMTLTNLQNFMANEAWILIVAIVVGISLKPLKSGDWGKLAVNVMGATVLIVILQGWQFWTWFTPILRWFNINL